MTFKLPSPRFSWIICVFWLILAVGFFIAVPSLSKVAKFDQTSYLPENSNAIRSIKLSSKLFPGSGSGSSVILVIERAGGLTKADEAYGIAIEEALLARKASLKIGSITSPFTQTALKGSMWSKDNEEALILIGTTTAGYMESTNSTVREIRRLVSGSAAEAPKIPEGLAIHSTGEAAIGEELTTISGESMALTMKITIVLVFLVLVIIYRSPITPFVPLLTIGSAFMIARGLIALLTFVGLRVSSFTETFLVAVLFGAGTDYCMLMISRYKEALSTGGVSARDALKAALPKTAIAILSSGGTVIVGFLAMVIAQFGLYNTTGPSIAIGVGITILAVLTLTPAILSLLGEFAFWPAHPSRRPDLAKPKIGGYWDKTSKLVTARSTRIILILLACFAPFIIFSFTMKTNFSMLDDLPTSSLSAVGFSSIGKHFAQGEVMPVRITVATKGDLWNNDSLAAIDSLAQSLLKIPHVSKVRAATRPLGDPIDQTRLGTQVGMIAKGFTSLSDALGQLGNGLSSMRDGVGKIGSGLSAGANSVSQLTDGMDEAISGVGSLRLAMRVATAKIKLAPSQESMLAGIDDSIAAANASLGSLDQAIAQCADAAKALGAGSEYKLAREALAQANSALKAQRDATAIITTKLAASRALVAKSASLGSPEDMAMLDSQLIELQKGLQAIAAGQGQMGDGMAQAAKGLSSIRDGLVESEDGVDQMKKGLGGNELDSYTKGAKSLNGLFFLPEGTLEAYPELKMAMENYISPSGKGFFMEAILDISPYSTEALDTAKAIDSAVAYELRGTTLEGSEYALGSVSAAYSELRDITSRDFTQVMIFVLLGIFIVLAILLKSLVAPIYLMATIVISYLTTMGLCVIVFQWIFGLGGLSWSVPFFSFCVLVALGVDYNIFLISRIKEEYVIGDMKGAIARALRSTGHIIVSCGIIMAGTFGALMASQMKQIVEIGFCTVIGLFLDTFIVCCVLVPAFASSIGEANWWPGRKFKLVPREEKKAGE